jgi:hypothetical protein
VTTEINTSLFFRRTRMTPARQCCVDMFNRHDEGLGARAVAVLLQMGDNDPRLREDDIEWLTSSVEEPVLAERVGDGWRLTEHGQRIYDLLNAGNWEEIIRLTTEPAWGLN